MSKAVTGLISYHVGRSAQELDRAARAETAARTPHLELSRLHLFQASYLREVTLDQSVAKRVD